MIEPPRDDHYWELAAAVLFGLMATLVLVATLEREPHTKPPVQQLQLMRP